MAHPLREQWTIINQKGITIQMYHELSPTSNHGPTKAVLLLHGLKSHYELEYTTVVEPTPSGGHRVVSDSSSSWAQTLIQEEGLAVFGMDHQGHGSSSAWNGSQINVERFDDYSEDVILALEDIDSRYPNIPICLVGCSLGGAIACRSLELIGQMNEPQFNLKSAVLLCPAVSIELLKAKPINKYLLPISRYFSYWLPYLKIAAVEDHPFLPELNEYIKCDIKSGQGSIPARLAYEAIAICDKVFDDSSMIGLNNPSLRLSFIHARGDGYVDYNGSERMYDKVTLTHKKIHTLEDETGLWHYLTLEPGTLEHVLPIVRDETRKLTDAQHQASAKASL